MSAMRRLGDGYEPHVDEIDGQLVYSLPVDSGHASRSFSFSISSDDLRVLHSDPLRRAALEVIAHILLQPRVGAGDMPQVDFDTILERVLHSAPQTLEDYIKHIGRDDNIHIDSYIEQALVRYRDT